MTIKELFKTSLCGIDEVVLVDCALHEKKTYTLQALRKANEEWYLLEVESLEPIIKSKISEFDGSLRVEASIRVYCYVNQQC